MKPSIILTLLLFGAGSHIQCATTPPPFAELICRHAEHANNAIKEALNEEGDKAKEPYLFKAAGFVYIIQRLESERSSDHPLISTHIIHFIRSEFDETCRTFFLKAMKEAAKTELPKKIRDIIEAARLKAKDIRTEKERLLARALAAQGVPSGMRTGGFIPKQP